MSNDNDTGVVSDKVAQSMQQASVSAPDAVETTQAPTTDRPKDELSLATMFPQEFSTFSINVMFTMGLADPRFLDGVTKDLAEWPPTAGVPTYNLYSPLRKGSKESKVSTGIIRRGLNTCLNAASLVNNSSLVFMGKHEQIYPALKSALGAVAARCTMALGFDPSTVVGEFKDESGVKNDEGNLLFSDIVRVSSWLTMNWKVEDEAPFPNHEGIINFYINSGMMYDAKDKLKAIRNAESTLRLAAGKLEDGCATVLFALNLSTSDLVSADTRDLIGLLLEDDGYELFTKQVLLDNMDKIDFVPKSKKSISEDLFNPRASTGDLLLVKMLTVDEPVTSEA